MLDFFKKLCYSDPILISCGKGFAMKLLFRQRFFSWFDSYDIYDESGRRVFEVRGELAWGHCLRIYDAAGNELGMIQEKVFTLLPRFQLYQGGRMIGQITKELTIFKPRFQLDFNGWKVFGDLWQWDYNIMCGEQQVAQISKQIWNLTDTYVIEVGDPADLLYSLMVVLAIDAAKCSANS